MLKFLKLPPFVVECIVNSNGGLLLYLKRLEIQGFKSFPEKISLEFSSGITSVVGPNGSGKSNIADAIRWVLGEQSVKTLRGSKMEDVIFAGTEHRKPLGFAEVSITLDNSDASLPIEFGEVTVTRRVFRSGESEYFINKTPCRLRDITELFLDTGIGRDGYSVIGQGRIDEILSTRSEDRRNIFEEASGIMKYKLRKIEAEKKLELTKQNLERINDIILELEAQLGPLKEQADTARKFLDLREELKVLDVNVYLDSMEKYRGRLISFEEQYNTLKDQIDAENKKLEDITGSNREKTELLKAYDEKLETARAQFYSLEAGLERSSSEIKLNNEKIGNLNSNIERLSSEIEEFRQKIAKLDEEDAGKQKKLDYLEGQLEEYNRKLREYTTKMDELLKTLDEEERKIELLKSSIMEKMDIQSDKKMQIGNVRNHMENMQKRQKTIDNEIYLNKLEKDRETFKKEELSESIKEASEKISALKRQLDEKANERNNLDKKLEELKLKQSKTRSDIQSKASRARTLREMEQNLEGYNRSVREVLKACKASSEFGKGIHGALAQIVRADRKYETAIEMALGPALQNIVTDSEEEAKKAIEYLKANRIGRATFLPLTAVKSRKFDSNTLEKISKFQGFCGVASELLEYENMYRDIIENLLGKVVVANNIDNAIKMARSFGYSFKIVTLEGDILNAGGSMTGGSVENRGTGILSRAREIAELEAELHELKKSDTLMEKEISELIQDVSKLNGEIASLESDMKNIEMVKIRDESQLNQVEENINKLLAKTEMLRNERAQIDRQLLETQKELQKYEKELLDIEDEISNAKKTVEEYQQKHKKGQAARDELHAAITDFRISVNSIKESIESVRENSERLGAEKESLLKAIARKEAEIAKCRNEIKNLEDLNNGLEEQIRKNNEEKIGKTLELDRLAEERRVLEEDLHDLINKINDINKNILILQNEYSKVEIKKARLEAEMEALKDRMWNEYELTYSSALELKKDIGSITQANRRITELRNAIKELGPVNVAAIEDYVKTKERYEFMTEQRNDAEQAREKLLKVIQEMTAIMKKQFIEQFKLINENFNIVFRELFNGGRACLRLADETNVLESGIEIEVQPPGKKLQNMMLLSGGERAFTAIALLFAILKLRPTPFCVLDEIEAALDDANVYRFIEYLRRYANQTQFIMVTHRKGTMEGSDMLYGVTMQEHGVSKIVSLKMGDKFTEKVG